jgi:hypothetical protein
VRIVAFCRRAVVTTTASTTSAVSFMGFGDTPKISAAARLQVAPEMIRLPVLHHDAALADRPSHGQRQAR